mmetsp:Transcript_22146/g.39448  ORF Transcript_22146/g.39448 Transcript_22146/m.39448 type:complete len:151 (-) Transcript_22146:134-586(-)
MATLTGCMLGYARPDLWLPALAGMEVSNLQDLAPLMYHVLWYAAAQQSPGRELIANSCLVALACNVLALALRCLLQHNSLEGARMMPQRCALSLQHGSSEFAVRWRSSLREVPLLLVVGPARQHSRFFYSVSALAIVLVMQTLALGTPPC